MFARFIAGTSLKKTKLSKITQKLQPLSLSSARALYHLQRCAFQSFSTTSGSAKNVTAQGICIQEVDKRGDDRVLNVVWNDGSASRFPYLFLRENCKCPECFHPSTKQRLINTVKDVGLNIKVKEAQSSEDGMYLNCLWPNGHRSVYPTSWLRERRMPEKSERDSKTCDSEGIVKDELSLWNSESMQDKIPRYEYDAIMHEDKSLFDCLYSLYQHGILLLVNAPARTGVIPELVARIGYHKPSHFGEIYDVKDKDDPSNLACTTGELYLHVDLPYNYPAPDIQSFHCIQKNADGGRSLYVDGFNIAKQLKKINPEAFDTLCQFIVPFVHRGADVFGEYCVGNSSPTIQLNNNGRLEKILYNHSVVADSFRNATPDEAIKFYDAYYEFTELLRQPENVVNTHLNPGQIVVFHNTRVLHGRTSFTPSKSRRRWLQGQFFDWDVIFSKLRVLHKNLGLETPYLHEQSNDFF